LPVTASSVVSRSNASYRAQREEFLPDSVLEEWERELFLLKAREVTVAFDRWDAKAAG
jgi:hypothetical protein